MMMMMNNDDDDNDNDDFMMMNGMDRSVGVEGRRILQLK
jgi:hypothetical protein